MKTVVTVLYGKKYSADDVHYIYEKTKQYSHVCIVDDENSKHLNKNIKQIRIEEPDGHWEKIKLFKNNWQGDCLYLDLDVIIQGSLDKLFDHCSKPTICYCYWKASWDTSENKVYDRPKRYKEDDGSDTVPWTYKWLGLWNSSVMAWNGNDARYIYDYFEDNDQYFMTKYCGDDRFLYHEKLFDNVFPRGLMYSFVAGVDFDIDTSPRGYKIKPEYPIVLMNGPISKDELRKKYYDALSLHEMGK